ncbi:MAG: hypothetical protein DMG24_18395 [Acidobacteria bacterium]|nr:MAG: hypothetical protein DMG24_18395 [Acidobacteriota bacterium]
MPSSGCTITESLFFRRSWVVARSSLRLAECVAGILALAVVNGAGQARPARPIDLAGRPVNPLVATGLKATVLIFTRTDCPVSNRYAPEIERIYAEFQPQHVAFWLIFLDPRESPEAIRRHVSECGYGLGVLRDPGHALVKLTGARVTPEVAVFIPRGSQARMVYRGRIDDKYVDFDELERVLKAVVEGKPVKASTTRAVGCFISDLESR